MSSLKSLTVGELREFLAALDPALPVFADHRLIAMDTFGTSEIWEVEERSLVLDKRGEWCWGTGPAAVRAVVLS